MFQDSLTKKIAETAAKIKTEPELVNVNEKSVEGAVEKIMNEKLIGNQHKIDANKNNKIDSHDFKLLRAKKKVEEEIDESSHDYEVKQSKTDPDVHHVHYKGKKIGYVSGNKKGMWAHEYEPMGTGDDGYSSKREAVNAVKDDHQHHMNMKEETELTESHFKVGDKVKCKTSGMKGKVVKMDKEDGGEDEAYYTVKREDGTMKKMAPSDMTKINEEVHNKKKDDTPSTSNSVKKPVRNSDGTIQSPISRARELAQQGLKKAMNKEETEQIDEVSKKLLRNYLKGSRTENQGSLGPAGHMSDKARSLGRTEQDKEDGRYEGQKLAKRKLGAPGTIPAKVMAKEETEIDEAMWPGTPEYKAKYGTDKEKHEAKYGKSGEKIEKYGYRGKEAEHGETDWSKETKKEPKKKYGARQNFVRSRRISGKQLKDSFSGLLDTYREGGLKSLKEMFVKEEPDNEQFTKEVEEQKKRDRGEIRNDKGVAKPLQNASVRENPVNPVREEVEELDEAMTRKHFQQVADVIKSHPDQEKRNELAKHHAGIFKASNPRFDHNRFYQAAGANIKEEVEQIDELSKSTLASYAKKASHEARMKHGIGKDFERISKSSRKPEYKQGAKEWEDKYKSDARRREAGVGKAIDRLAKEEVEELDEAMTRKHFQQVADVIKSHPDQEKRNELAKHHAGIFKASNPRFDHSRFYQAAGANIKEEVEELDELSNKTLTDFETRARFSSDPKHREGAQQARKKVSGMSDRLRQGKLNNPMMKSKPSMSNEETDIAVINADIANGVQFDNIEERSLTEPEMKKKEEIVKSMKKGMEGFKARYGDRAKQVAYATATKIAKEKA